MRESVEYNQEIIWRHIRHCVVLTNAILALAWLHYAVYLGYGVIKYLLG